jgi:hypothetical protein
LSSWPLESRAGRAARWSALEVVALLLVGAGIAGLAFGGLSYTSVMQLGLETPPGARMPASLPVTVGVGLGAVVLGGALYLSRRFEYLAGADVRLRWPR